MASPSSQRRRLYIVALVMDMAFFCGWATVPFLVKQGDALQLDDGALGLLVSISAVVYVGGALFLSRLWTRGDPVVVTRIAGIASGLGFVFASMASAAWQLFFWLALGRLALSAFWPNLMGLVGEAPGKSLVQRIASFNCWWGSGKAVAFLVCGSLLSWLGDPALALRVCGVLAIASVAVLPRPESTRASRSTGSAESHGSETLFVIGLVGIFASAAVGAMWENQFPKGLGALRFATRFGDRFELGINLLLFALFAGQACAFFVLRAWVAWPGKAWTLLVAAVLLATSQIALLFAASPLVMACLLFVSGLTFAVFYSQSLYHAQAGSTQKARRSGIHEAMLSLGSVVGPPCAGYAALAAGDVRFAFIVATGFSALCLVAVTAMLLSDQRSMRLKR